MIEGLLDGIVWFIRRYHYQDILAGPLLPYGGESHEFRYIVEILRRQSHKPVFVDVGAYVGGYSVRVCKLGACWRLWNLTLITTNY